MNKIEYLKKIAELWNVQNCKNSEHNPPTMIVLEPGIHEHKCPECNKTTLVNVPKISWEK